MKSVFVILTTGCLLTPIEQSSSTMAESRRTTANFAKKALISKPIKSSNCTIAAEILAFDYSYGYNCKRPFNLCKIDDNVLVFASGNLIHFFDVTTQTVTTRRSSTGGGIGCIQTNPNPELRHLTVGENGSSPPIIIFQYPEMLVVNILKNGTAQAYSRVDYSADGELLVSQGCDPDYMLTVWNWRNGEIILRCKSFSNDVINVMFSPTVPGHLTSCGLGHIKFWKMAETFTGLKLQGELGRFGKTEISDIIGILPMADEKVLSGCQWGNILVWEAGLIKMEVCRKGRKPCHQGPITQITIRDGEVMTSGMDGFIRIWFWETVELADPPDDDRVVQIEPIMEFKIGTESYSSELMCLIKKEGDFKWYAQDSNGGIWLCDITPAYKPAAPIQLLKCHAGPIVSVQTSPTSQHVATLGADGRLFMYDYIERRMVFNHQFDSNGRAMQWLPVSLDPTGKVLVLGFEDGCIRFVTVNLDGTNRECPAVNLVQIMKSHSKAVTVLAINTRETILVSGSEDSSIFVHQFIRENSHVTIEPIGLVYTPSEVYSISWKPNFHTTAFIGCRHGQVLEVELPEEPVTYTDISYHLKSVDIRQLTFQSVKSEIKRNIRIAELEDLRQKKRARKMESLERVRIENPGVDIDENAFLEDSEDEEELEPLYIPKIPNAVLWVQYTEENTLWLSMGGYDAGFVYEYCFDDEDPVSCTSVYGAEDTEMNTYIYDSNYFIFGMSDGSIRVNRCKSDFRDLSDYWTLNMHYNLGGKVTGLAFSYDYRFLFSVGTDGNLFAYKWNADVIPIEPEKTKPLKIDEPCVDDILDAEYLSLEEQKLKQESDRKAKVLNDKKNEILANVATYKKQFEALLARNEALPESQKIPMEAFSLDDRITEDLERELQAEMDLVRRKTAFDVEKARLTGEKLRNFFLDELESIPAEIKAVNVTASVKSFRINKLNDEFHQTVADLEQRIKDEEARRRMAKTSDQAPLERHEDSETDKRESFLEGLSQSTIDFKLESKMRRLLAKYRERKSKERMRKLEWEELKAKKPNPNVNHPDDDLAIKEASETIGDYKLKTDLDYEPNEDELETTMTKYRTLLRVREQMFTIKHEYNKQVFALRDKKTELVKYVECKKRKLAEIHEEIPENQRKMASVEVKIDVAMEFPEREFEQKEDCGSVEKTSKTEESSPTKVETIEDADFLQKYALGLVPSPNGVPYTPQGTEWEKELREMRLMKKLFKQDKIIAKINQRVSEFDGEIEKLAEQRLKVEVDAKYLEIYQLTLYQELWILKDFEKIERKMISSVEDLTLESNHLQVSLIETRSHIDQSKLDMDEIRRKQKSVLNRFTSSCTDNSFAVFLKRIFKKKYKPCRINQETDETESSSEYSSEDIDALENAVDGEISKIFLNEQPCPVGCDPDLYELTLRLRNEKNDLEKQYYDENKTLNESIKTMETFKMKLAFIETRLADKKKELLSFRRTKQTRLNDINSLVILKMDQMQHFRTESEFYDIENSLLFNHEKLMKLYSRVGQLAMETLETKRKHRVNVVHLARMRTDIKFMEQQIIELKEQLNEAMIKKFGRIVDLDELEETILRKFAFEIRANMDDVKKAYAERTRDLKIMYSKKQTELTRVIQEGTEKLHILTVLQEEHNKLTKLLANQDKLMEKKDHDPKDYEPDLIKLKEIARTQKEQINALQREIRTLSVKCKPLSTDVAEIVEPVTVSKKSAQISDDATYPNAMDSAPPSTRASSPDNFLYNEISSLVDDFLTDHLGTLVQKSDIKCVVTHLSHYLTNIIANFAPEHASDLLPHIIENFKSFIPEELLLTIPPQSIAELIENIFRTFKEGYDIDTKEILNEIINNSLEMVPPVSQNYSHNILADILKQVVSTLHISDIVHPETINFIANGLRNKPGIDPVAVNVNLLTTELLQYSSENLVDDVNRDTIRQIINGILQQSSK
ncbi:cilia- and flagella-associated protein 44 isoform X2 [Malaya genurostris]|uniref:cilia- and flagella-associated protein 44 isoform X2 n=1 Tax=Malaya genurostris TaxID=325434 RepID=UPI0026F3814C|nr:cilia- and flagella-associated protein 44 isoform X2 [Malaya genurostris]